MATVEKNGHADPSSNLDEAVCISHSSNTFGEKYASQIWVNIWANWNLQFWHGAQSRRRKTLNSNLFDTCVRSCSW